MNSSRFLLAGIVASILFFLLGWVIYGMALTNYFNEHLWAAGMMKDKPDPMWVMIVGQLFGGFFFAYVIGKANATSVASGAMIGFVASLLVCLSFDFTFYAIGKFYVAEPLGGIAVDAIVSAVIGAVVGGVVSWVYGMKKAVAAA